ncbi:hypothetical protein CYMTET_15273 [Cymbomonas tetramitiformis]|uniref:Uncharacterized protein n=1 Tax=Cymbomonas tetramitiformis TaxID=36881 RepID=A0AAE0GEW1_9CHLO|nr:hypothetical protein CYMTET_15273 [Cymbomonas tetramitiformis]
MGRWSASVYVLAALLLSRPLLNEAQDNTSSPTATPARQCSGDNRGWLTSGADTGEHPRGNFGPVGLHSAHFLTPVETNEVSTTVILGGKATNYYYPDTDYQIKLRCTPSCAFLLTVESGPLNASQAEQQEGSFQGVEEDSRLALYEGLKSYIAVTNTNFITSAYTIIWRAPNELTYQPLTVRVTWVLDNEFQCPGIFTELVLTSEIVCGDGYKDQYEDCDDDNLIAGDGCSPTCEVEIGWVCEERQRLSICTQALVLFTPADPYEIRTVEGYETQYNMVLTTPIQESKFVYILVTPQIGGEAFIVGETSFEFAAVGDNAWNVERTVVVSAPGNRLVDHRRNYTISHVLSSTDPNYEHNYGNQGANLEPPQMTVIIEDDDGVDIILSRVNITVSEGGSDEFYTISLGSEPSGRVHIAITSEPAGQVYVTPNAIFDANNWNEEAVISVAAIDNSNLDGTVVAKIHHQIFQNATTDENYSLLNTDNKTIRVTVIDNDTPGVVVSPRSLSVTESKQGDYYAISLLSNNEKPVRIDFVTSEGIEAMHALGSYCIFAADGEDWGIPKYIQVRALNNSLEDGERVETLTHTITSEYLPYNDLADTDPAAPWEILVYVSDDDVAAVVHGDLVNITEGQDASTFSMHLLTQPTAPVRVYFDLEDASYVKIGLTEREGDERYIEWLPEDWSVTKTITLEALADSEYPDSTDNGVRETKMYMLSWSDDTNYNDILNKPVQVLVYDNDYAAVIVEPTTGISLDEGGSAIFTVHLATKPQANADSGAVYPVNIQSVYLEPARTSPDSRPRSSLQALPRP